MPQGARYDIKNEVVIGALLLPGGLGSARESTHCPFRLLGYNLRSDSGRANCRPTFRPRHRQVAREEKRMLGSRGPATRCTARRTDPPALFGLAVGCIHTLCPGDTRTRAQHGLPVRQRNRGAYSSIFTNGENF
jgi:hypothetical protein